MCKKYVVSLAVIAVLIALPVYGQFVGPGAELDESPKSVDVKSILANPVEDDWVSVKGHIVEKIGRQKYIFSDGTGQILLEMDDVSFPLGIVITPKTTVEISGEVEAESNGTPAIDVDKILVIQERASTAKTSKHFVKEGIRPSSPPNRIKFDRKKVVKKNLRLPRQMVNDAMEREPNFNKLVEMLLWDFLDKDPKYLRVSDR